MESIKRTNKATLIAASLLMTIAISVFGVSAANDSSEPNNRPFFQELTDEQKEVMEQVHEKMEEAHAIMEEAREMMEEAGIQHPMMGGKIPHPRMGEFGEKRIEKGMRKGMGNGERGNCPLETEE